MVRYILIIVLLILAATLIRRGMDMRRLKRLSEQMEDVLTGQGGRLSISLKEDTIAQVENAAAEMQNRIENTEERFREEARRTSNLTADISHQLTCSIILSITGVRERIMLQDWLSADVTV